MLDRKQKEENRCDVCGAFMKEEDDWSNYEYVEGGYFVCNNINHRKHRQQT